MKKTLIVITGPTGVGKTDLSLILAKYFACPIISADSRQIFKDIPIGTATPSINEMGGVKHYFINILELTEQYNVSRFETEAISLITELFEVHNTLICVGGSMLYIDALCNGIDIMPSIDDDIRQKIQKRYNKEGIDLLAEELKNADPIYYSQVDKKNHKRILHALEVYEQTGSAFSSFRTNTKKERPFKIIKIGIEREREELFARINKRVDNMIIEGLLQEAKSNYHQRHLNSLNTVGYKELFCFLDGECTIDEAIEKIKVNTRKYAKQQLRWFKKDREVQWYNLNEVTNKDIIAKIKGQIIK